jgi:hypothetical protein
MSNNGIFCLEGTWSDERTPVISVLPMLEILFKSAHVDYIHHMIKSPNDFEKKIITWRNEQRDNYPILYLAFHGQKNSVYIGSTSYSLHDICSMLERSCQHSIIMFASCKTLRVPEVTLRHFFHTTGVWALFGYDRMVTWMHAAACEFLTLSSLQSISFSKRSTLGMKNRLECYQSLYNTLGFHYFTWSDFQ